jgi:hypothetical protein
MRAWLKVLNDRHPEITWLAAQARGETTNEEKERRSVSMNDHVAGMSSIKVNKLANGWTWNIQVAASGNTLEELQDAKRKALKLNEELFDELYPQPEPCVLAIQGRPARLPCREVCMMAARHARVPI